MKGYKYDVSVCDSTLDHVHGFYHSIKEIFIPKYNLCFNEQGYAFSSSEARNEGVEVNIPEELVKRIRSSIKTKDDTIKFFNNYETRKKVRSA